MPTKKPPLTMKRLDRKLDQLRRFVFWAMTGFACIAVGAGAAEVVFLVNASNEKDRTCDSIDGAFDSFLDVFIPGLTTRRPSLPPRPADEQAQLDALIAKFRGDVDQALAACGDR